jgi:hypothetical protein
MEVQPPTEEEVRFVLRNHRGRFLDKSEIACEIARRRHAGEEPLVVKEVAPVLLTALRGMRLRDMHKVCRRS